MHRGIGQYPGNPSEFYGPTIVDGTSAGYRNLAFQRPVYQSSAWDFNLTAQLLTDGFFSQFDEVAWLEVTSSDGPIAANCRESAIDGNEWTCNTLSGSQTWLQYDWHGMSIDVDKMELVGSVTYDEQRANGKYSLRLLTSSDGKNWTVVSEVSGSDFPGNIVSRKTHSDPNKNTEVTKTASCNIKRPYNLQSVGPISHLRIELQMQGAIQWTITELKMSQAGARAQGILPATHFSSAWRSGGHTNEWITVDLGSSATINSVCLHWVSRPISGKIALSDDGEHWHIVDSLDAYRGMNENVTIANAQARYVKVEMSSNQSIMMSELEVMGIGGVIPQYHAESGNQTDGHWLLDGGNWQLQRASQVPQQGSEISSRQYNSKNWLTATVPATVLMSHVWAGVLPDMNYDDNLMLSSESYFEGDFWYRRTFDLPQSMMGKRVTLNFDGINWKAEVWLNGMFIGHVDGAFQRGMFDITNHLSNSDNILAIKVIANANPGGVKVKTALNTDFNGGILGADNPTFHATVGWDWISTIRGRDIGIWDDVYLKAMADVEVKDPVVSTRLTPNDTLATMMPAVMVVNHSHKTITGLLKGHIGSIQFQKTVTLNPMEQTEVTFSPNEFPQLSKQHMQLWWPNGYGKPYLHDASFAFLTDDSTLSNEVRYQAGIREVTYTDMDSCLRIYVNHQRITPLGGNWAFSENNLCYRGREYDATVRYHREMNYNMIRNWVGMTSDAEFYDACDRYGIMVWQDFWLANPADGPDPDDEKMFMDNARDLVLKIRRHPSIAIYCGRNEGYPPQSLDTALHNIVYALHPRLGYISSSADDGVSGHGPYRALEPQDYFEIQTGKLHTERGMPNVMTYDGLSRTLDPEHLWPQNLYWGRHDFTMEGAQRGSSFNQLIINNFGNPQSAKEFCQRAQWINYEGYRAMYEADGAQRMGLLIWMSHPCWPSMVWQTYDYYLEPTAAYFGVKRACEPLHVQFNPLTQQAEVINRTLAVAAGKLVATIYDLGGKVIWTDTTSFNVHADNSQSVMNIKIPSSRSNSSLLRLTYGRYGETMSTNDYMLPNSQNNRFDLTNLPLANINVHVSPIKIVGHRRFCSVTIENVGNMMAVMLRLNLKGSDGEQVLPVIYSNNYLHVLPQSNSDEIVIEWDERDCHSLNPVLELSGDNVALMRVSL